MECTSVEDKRIIFPKTIYKVYWNRKKLSEGDESKQSRKTPPPGSKCHRTSLNYRIIHNPK